MEQSVSRRSRVGVVVKIAFAMLLSLAGLTVVGVGTAVAAAGPPTVTGLGPGFNGTGNCPAGTGYGGDSSGGNEIAVCGSNFGIAGNTTTTATIGGANAPVVNVLSASRMYVDAPPAASSTAAEDVVVKNTLLTNTTSTCGGSPGCTYTYTWQAPTVSAVGLIPVTGTVQSGGSITVTAAGTWTAGQEVALGGFSNHLTSAIYTITTGGNGTFTFPFAGLISGTGTGVVSPTPAAGVGPAAGGNHVIIAGTNLAGASSVMFGSTPATSYVVNSGSQITAVAPPAAGGALGPVNITVTNPNSTSGVTPQTDTYTYIGAPAVTGVSTVASPVGGPTGGGTNVTISGSGFNSVSAVDFGATAATSFLTNSLTSITAIAPAGTGTQDITVTTGLGTSPIVPADQYAYNGTLAAAPGTASYSNSPGTDVPVTATSQSGSVVTISAIGSWQVGLHVGLSGFSNGLTAGTYTITGAPTLGSFTVTFAGATTGSSTGTVLIPNSATTSAATATSQAGSVVTVTATGTWYAGEQLYLSGFTNGLTANTYAVVTGGTGSFTVNFAGSAPGTSTGTIVPFQVQSFNAATLVTGGTSVGAVTVTTQPSSGNVAVVGDQLLYTPDQGIPTSYTIGTGATQTTTWLQTVNTTGTQTATVKICETPQTTTCTTTTMTYVPSASGFYVGNQLSAAGQIVSVVEDTASGTSLSSSTPTSGSTFTTTIAPPMTVLPSTNSGFTVSGIGGYRSITEVPSGLSLVPGTLTVSGGDTFSSSRYTVTLCTAAMGFVAGTCTANNAPNFNTTYPYIETSLNAGSLVAGGSQISLPTISATWNVTAPSGTVLSSAETEFSVVTVVQTIGTLVLDAYPTDLASDLNQGLNAPVPTYAAPAPRWTATVQAGGPSAPSITSADNAAFTEGSPGSFTVTTNGNPTAAITKTGTLPAGVTLVDNGDGTATLSGTPAAGTSNASPYTFTIKAANGVNPDATQSFTLTVNPPSVAPTITSDNSTIFKVGTAGTFTVTTTGSPTAAITKTGNLPSGVTLVDNGDGTATLSGTPAAGTAGNYPITITANNGVTPNATQNFTLTVGQAPSITSLSSATFKVGTAGTFTVTTTGTPAAAITKTGPLPSGVTLVDNGNGTATLAGTPSAGTGGSYPITITANNGVTPNATQNFTLTVDQAPTITSTNSTTFSVGTAGTFTVTTAGEPNAAITEAGSLPGGVTLHDNGDGTATLSGTPIIGTNKAWPITITANNGITPNATQSFTLTVVLANTAPTITSGNATTFTVGTAGSFSVTTSGFPAPAITKSGALPGGVTFVDNGNGTATLAGTPAAGSGGTYPLTITANNGVNPNGTQNFTLTVSTPTPPTITSANHTTFTVGTAGTFSVTTTGNPTAAITESGALPSGVTLHDNGNGTATLAGTPAAGSGGSYPITITANNGANPNATQSFTLTVQQAPAITSANSATFVIGTANSFTVTTAGHPTATITESGSLPTGVTFVDNGDGTATLAGTAAAGTGGSYPITLTANNGVSPNATENFTVIVPVPPAPPTVTGVTPGDASATVTWTPGSDGGSPIISYTATATPTTVPMALLVPGTESCTVPAPATSCTITGLTNGVSYTFSVVATNSQGTGTPSAQSAPATPTANGAIQGYWMATSTGGVFANGAAVSYGSPAGLKLDAPIVALTPTPDRKGYWMVGSDGGVFAYGDAAFYGSTGGQHLNAPIVGMASTSDGLGYWLVAADGGVFAYGDAAFAGSTGGQHINAPMVGIAGNGTGGYWLVASDGGVFAYGSATFNGSAGALKLVSPVVGISAVPGGGGYYLAGADGGVFAFGSAPYLGSASGVATSPVVGITGGAAGGYTLATSTGGVYAYGTGYFGNLGSIPTGPVIGIAS